MRDSLVTGKITGKSVSFERDWQNAKAESNAATVGYDGIPYAREQGNISS
jgi:hypothetical protein